ncbi:hypothetical protein [Curtobacterium phage Parvaparticeps]|nr:hypothetical protein [Curtobacterium phage Parvaparticeps]
MTDFNSSEEPVAGTLTGEVRDVSGSPFTLANAKKAYSAGVGAGILAAGAAVTGGGVFEDGKIDGSEVAVVVGAFVVGFVGGFVAAFVPANGKKVS